MANATVFIEVKTIGKAKATSELKAYHKEASSIIRVNEQLANQAKNNTANAFARIATASNKSRESIRNFNAQAKKAGVGFGEVTRAGKAYEKTLLNLEARARAGKNVTVQLTNAQNKLNATLGSARRRLSDVKVAQAAKIKADKEAVRIAKEHRRELERSRVTQVRELKEMAKKAVLRNKANTAETVAVKVNGRFRESMLNATKSVTLALGPLSGVASRLTAFSGIVTQANLKIASFVTAIVGVGGLIYAANKAANSVDAMRKSAESAGFALADFQSLNFAASQMAGVDDASRGLERFTKSLGEASVGSGEATRIFKMLGIELSNISERAPADVLAEVADKTAQLSNASQRALVATQLFGRSQAKLVKLLEGGSAAIREQAEIADQYGLILGDTTVAKATRLVDSMDILGKAFGNAASKIFLEFGDAIGYAARGLARFAKVLADNSKGIAHSISVILGAMVGFLFGPIGALIGGVLGSIVGTLITHFEGLGKVIVRVGLWFTDFGNAITGLANTGMPLIDSALEGTGGMFTSLGDAIQSSGQDLVDYATSGEDAARINDELGRSLDALLQKVDAAKISYQAIREELDFAKSGRRGMDALLKKSQELAKTFESTNKFINLSVAEITAMIDPQNRILVTTGNISDAQRTILQYAMRELDTQIRLNNVLAERDLQDQLFTAKEALRYAGLESKEVELQTALTQRKLILLQRGVDLRSKTAQLELQLTAQIVRTNQAATELQDTTDRMVNALGEGFIDAFSDAEQGFKDLADIIRKEFVDLIAELAREAFIRPIIMPVIQQSMAGVAGSPGSSGGTSGLLSAGSNIFDLFSSSGFNGYSLIGSGGSVIGNSFIQSGIAQSIGLSQGAVSGIGPALPTSFGNMVGTGLNNLGNPLSGPAGFAGNFIGSQLFDQSTASTAGGVIGGIVGGLALGPVGAFLGALAGNGLGSMFGTNPASVGPTGVAITGNILNSTLDDLALGVDNGGDSAPAEAALRAISAAAIAIEKDLPDAVRRSLTFGLDVGYFPNPEPGSHGDKSPGFTLNEIINGVKKELFINGMTGEEVLLEGVVRTLRGAFETLGDANLDLALENSIAEDLEGLIADLNFASSFEQMFLPALDAVGPFELQLEALADSFDEAKSKAIELGLSTEKLAANFAQANEDAKLGFRVGLRAEASGVGDEFSSLIGLGQELKQLSLDAETAGVSANVLSSVIDSRFRDAVQDLDKGAIRSLLGSFEHLIGKVQGADIVFEELQQVLGELNGVFDTSTYNPAILQAVIDYNEKRIDLLEEEASLLEDGARLAGDFARNLRATAQGFLTDPNLSPLSGLEQVNEARSQYQAALDLANDSTPFDDASQDALKRLPDLSKVLLTSSRAYYASSEGYLKDFNLVQRTLNSTALSLETIEEQQLGVLNGILSEIASLKAAITSAQTAINNGAANPANDVGNYSPGVDSSLQIKNSTDAQQNLHADIINFGGAAAVQRAQDYLANNPDVAAAAAAGEFGGGLSAAFNHFREFGQFEGRAFANGGAFTNSVVTKPTAFNMGLMGEAGAEAILPLRNVGGDLGVQAIAPANDTGVRDLIIVLQEDNRLLREKLDQIQTTIALSGEMNAQATSDVSRTIHKEGRDARQMGRSRKGASAA